MRGGQQPAIIGFGATSEPICGCSFELPLAAVREINWLWRAIEAEQAGCSVGHCQGHTLHTMKLKATSERGVERIVRASTGPRT